MMSIERIFTYSVFNLRLYPSHRSTENTEEPNTKIQIPNNKKIPKSKSQITKNKFQISTPNIVIFFRAYSCDSWASKSQLNANWRDLWFY